MASIGEINANGTKQSSKSERENLPYVVIFGVFFDGTGNNMIQKKRAKALKKKLDDFGDDLNKDKLLEAHQELQLSNNGSNSIAEELVKDEESDFSNIAALHNSYIGLNKSQQASMEENEGVKIRIFNIYIQGAGTNEVWTDTSNFVGAGFGLGDTGVVALVTKAIRLIDIVVKGLTMDFELDNKVYFDVFGFSRGATCARMFAHYVNGDLPLTRGYKDLFSLKKSYLSQFRNKNRKVSYLGIFDTVSSIGINYDDNNIEYGLYSPNEAWVEHTFHICAIDEFRDHFRLTDVGNAVNNNALEIYLPGCHSDIGGGYKSGSQTMRIRYGLPKLSIGVKPASNLLEVNPLKANSTAEKDDINPIKIYNSMPDGQSKGITIDWLNQLGWHNSDNSSYSVWTDKLNHILNITRFSNRGYSNITLELMKDKAIELTGREMFDRGKTSRFTVIDEDLKTFHEKIKDIVKTGVQKGKYIITPDEIQYRLLRSNFLHFSASDSLIAAGKKTSIVNAPTVENLTLNRIIYKGDIGVSESHYMYPNCL